MAPFCRLLPTAYRSLAPNASVQKRARNAWHVRALEHLLDHGLERGHDRAPGDMLGRAADLIAFERLGVVDGDGDAAVIRGEVAQRRVQEHIADDELAVVRTSSNATGTTFGTPAAQVARSHMFSLSSFLTFSLSAIRSSLWFLSLSSGSQTTREKQDIRKFMSDS